jgi:hypothetical protein
MFLLLHPPCLFFAANFDLLFQSALVRVHVVVVWGLVFGWFFVVPYGVSWFLGRRALLFGTTLS